MRRSVVVGIVMMASVGLMCCTGNAPAGGHGHAKKVITLEGRLNCPYLSIHGGTAYLQLAVTAPNVPHIRRRPLNVAVVLDRSGSMGTEEKITQAKAAVSALIDRLDEHDIFSLVIYDDVVEVVRAAAHVRDRGELRRIVEEVYPRGWTNLGGGMMEGFRQAERYAEEGHVNRVILLSDGLANRGVTDMSELQRIACRWRKKGISLTTMGVGYDFNENLMVGLSEEGGGNYYFIESSRSLASVFRKEFDLMSDLAARNASIELTLGEGVRVLDVIGYQYASEGNCCTILLGDLYGSEQRHLTVELAIPPGKGSRLVATGRLRCDSEFAGVPPGTAFRAVVRYTSDLAEVDRRRDLEAQALSDVAVSTRHVGRAMTALDEGNEKEAAEHLAAAAGQIAASPAASAEGAAGTLIGEQKAKLESYQETMDKDKPRAKKAIQYDNYQTQKRR